MLRYLSFVNFPPFLCFLRMQKNTFWFNADEMGFVKFDTGDSIELSTDFLVKNSRECYHHALPLRFLSFHPLVFLSLYFCVVLPRFPDDPKRKTHHFEPFIAWNPGEAVDQRIQCTKVSKMEECPVNENAAMVCYRVEKNLYSLSRTLNMLELNGEFVSSFFHLFFLCFFKPLD